MSEPELNLWEGIRQDTKEYFIKNGIAWWSGNEEPTGHLLSSQIACLNHLYPLRQRKDCTDKILQNICDTISESLFVDSGLIEFEKLGLDPWEKNRQPSEEQILLRLTVL